MDSRISALLPSRSGGAAVGGDGPSYASSGGGTTAGTLSPMIGGVTASITTRAGTGVADITSGRISLAMLEVIAVGLVVFYVWTHGLQDGL